MSVLAAAVPGSSSPGRVPLAEALPRSDYVSLHCPLTTATTHLVNAQFLSQIRQDAVLLKRGAGSEAARAFIAFLKGPKAVEIITHS